ncbi:50S ribosomal protein L35 [Brachyspira alvinipulli]|uniref:50S ribosomal protein L35 n=1 Tax=Brachyspira alvinipulli TaxID=84379 RepID=UPI003006815C
MKQKLKTKSGAKKRFRFSKSGKVKFAHAFGSHKFLNKRPDTKRKYRKARIADDTNMAEMPRLMPYSR